MRRTRSDPGQEPESNEYEGEADQETSRRVTVKAFAAIARRAVGRHRAVFAGILLGGVALLILYFAAQTPLYRVQTRLLAQRQQAVPSIVRSSVPNEVPTRAASEVILRRENIVALIKHAGLLDGTQAPAPDGFVRSLRRALRRITSPATSDDDPMNALALRVSKALMVETGEGTITISIDWPNPQQAYALVEGALQNFLEARQLQEITAIDDAITLLQGRVATLRDELDVALATSASFRNQSVDASPRALPGGATAVALGSDSGELAILRASLDAKERAIRDMEDFRRRRMVELQAQYEERRGVYAEAHPTLVALRREIESMSAESPQLVALREEEASLRTRYVAASRQATASAPRAPRAPSAVRAVALPSGAQESERVRDARFRYQQMVERLNGAQLDLDSARAAFKYRYSVVWPAEFPRKPASPNPLRVFGIGGILVVILAVAFAVWLDQRAGLILTRDQLEDGMGVPVLGEFERRS
jgi:uncharacterized protein involved in exopolysaccharide biosynthesis